MTSTITSTMKTSTVWMVDAHPALSPLLKSCSPLLTTRGVLGHFLVCHLLEISVKVSIVFAKMEGQPPPPAAAAAAGGGDWTRETNHDPDASWNSTHRPLFDQVMLGTGMSFANISMEDLEAENGLLLMTEFVNRCAANPPISNHTQRPFGTQTLQNCVGAVVRKLQEKFRSPNMFPTEEVQKWKKKLRDNHNRVQMQGEDETDVLKGTFPIPREHSNRTRLYPPDDFTDEARRDAARKTDMLGIAECCFRRERFKQLLMTLLTFSGIDRGGETKFLNCKSCFFAPHTASFSVSGSKSHFGGDLQPLSLGALKAEK